MALNLIINAVSGAPWWVWFVLCYICFVGIRAIKSRTVPIPRLFIIPVVFILLKSKAFSIEHPATLFIYIAWLLGGCVIGFYFASKTKIKVFKKTKSVELPGSYQTLLLAMSFFIMKFIFGFLQAVDPDLAAKYLGLDVRFNGLLSGYLLGRSLSYLQKYVKNKK